MMRVRLLFLVSLLVFGHSFEYKFPLHTQGKYVVDASGKRVKFAGVNWYGLDSTDYALGGLHVNKLENIADLISAWNFTAVRLPWSLQLWESNPVVNSKVVAANTDLIGAKGLQIMDRVVNALADRNILIMLDNHVSIAGWCCSNNDGNGLWYSTAYPASSYYDDWRAIVARYKNVSHVVAADIRNEPRCDSGGCPNWGKGSYTDFASAAEWIGNAIHEINPNLLIVVEGINYALDLTGVANRPVKLSIPNKVVYSAHDYSWDYSFTTCGNMEQQINTRWGYIFQSGNVSSPLFVGEFGTDYGASSAPWLTCLLNYLQKYNLDWFYWALDGTESSGAGRTFGSVESFGLTDPTWSKPSKPELLKRFQDLL